ncbi:uncharacterized protein L969DRAFT_94448 [Mixia osmundae IAM 14324]|uniref:U3 small nucleolar ribonucleoprotein protein IMP4 n=1 Tax=Mixia osmundae (strain CBS 9802 / IAM 14324 / JCM 22182 / KY 12970) TaxID=764103 RepID=G7E3I1_MIXOS|nr:uncharacterized protein L969DRAFT_94448 [Mixia osmundae IAM 14324]KEI39378.1 hypothetical protein L969DRAFT_94448 [Mixia osmundae IAM 14324]GAA97391.1 hypothetical protein E5Q_04069 [Mixia osmundae IAM 14324]
MAGLYSDLSEARCDDVVDSSFRYALGSPGATTKGAIASNEAERRRMEGITAGVVMTSSRESRRRKIDAIWEGQARSEMIRRQTRQRREYLYKKALETQERQIWERKQKVKDALARGKAVPSDLRKDQEGLEKDLKYDNSQAEPSTHIDDEYSQAGLYDPNIVVTTSRDPSSRLAQFAKEMRLVLPNAHRLNRGNAVMRELAEACRANNVTDLVVLHEHRGVPDAMIVSHFPHGPTTLFTLHNVVLRHDTTSFSTSTVSEQYPHLIFDNFSSKLGNRIQSVLKHLFPVPKPDATRTMTFANEGDFISFRHHIFVKSSHKEVQLAEVGPRFEMRAYEIRQGTIEQADADIEWVLRPYQRTASKRNQL